MAVEAALADLMTQTVHIAPYASVNTYAEKSYGADVEYQCRIVRKPKLVRDEQGREVVSNATIWLATAPGIGTNDRVTLPDGSQPQILYVARFPDENGADHHEAIYV